MPPDPERERVARHAIEAMTSDLPFMGPGDDEMIPAYLDSIEEHLEKLRSVGLWLSFCVISEEKFGMVNWSNTFYVVSEQPLVFVRQGEASHPKLHLLNACEETERTLIRCDAEGVGIFSRGELLSTWLNEEAIWCATCWQSVLICEDQLLEAFAPKRDHAQGRMNSADVVLQQALAEISRGENQMVEFKSSYSAALEFDRAAWKAKGLSPQEIDQKFAESEQAVIHSTLKTIAAFINSEGGTLYLGVRNDGTVLGLEADYKRKPKQPDADGLELTIRAMLKSRMEPAPHSLIDFTLLKHEGKEFFMVTVKHDFDPHHLDGDQLFIRDGNQTVLVKGPALTRWVLRRHEQKQRKS